jgi:hypothetical protein
VKRTLIAALASLMLAGAISAVNGGTASKTTGMIVVVGEGSAPIPLAATADNDAGEAASHGK